MNIFDAYFILGVHPGLPDEEIKKSHRELSRRYHPDRPQADVERFSMVQEAYKLIKDAQARKQLRTRLVGLGDPCGGCGGRGFTAKSRNWVVIGTQPCDKCGSCGFVERR